MSLYSHQQMCLATSADVKLKLVVHPKLPHSLLTVSADDASGSNAGFTISGPHDVVRQVVRDLVALFEESAGDAPKAQEKQP